MRVVLFLLGLAIAGCQFQERVEDEPLNVLLILVDDLGHADLGVTGSKFYETPNVDAIANEGFVFSQGYAGSRVCSPSRATLMTGKFTARHGITDWIGARSGEGWREMKRFDKLLPAEYIHNLPHEETTIAEALFSYGYKTFYAGKWHLGNVGSYPEDHGFQINRGGWEKGSPIGGYFSPWENPSLENLTPGENLSMRLANETATFIRDNKDSTFFAVLSFYAVHGPIQTTKEKWSKYQKKAMLKQPADSGYRMERVLPIREVQDNPIYGGLVETMDDAVGVVLDELKKQGLDQKTIVIFTSDNGGVSSGDNFSTSNLPLRGGKGYQWQGGLRVPYFIKVPGIAAGSSDYPVTGADFYPTILDLLDLPLDPVQHQDGISLKPILTQKELPPVRALFWHYPHYGNQGGEPSSVILDDQWKLIHYWEDQRSELYNLESDIHEDLDLSQEEQDKADQMEAKLIEFLSGVKAQYPIADPEYDTSKANERKRHILEELWPRLEQQRKTILLDDYEPDSTWWGSLRLQQPVATKD